jgi:hypothetical protein
LARDPESTAARLLLLWPLMAERPAYCCTFWLSRFVGHWAQNRNSAPTDFAGLSRLKE